MKGFLQASSLILSLLLVFAGCNEIELPVSVKFNNASYTVKVGDTLDLGKELKIENSEEKPVFRTSDADMATVSETGLLTALAAGEVVIKANVEGEEASTTVQITDLAAESISFVSPTYLIAGEDWKNVVVTVKPEGYNAENLEWTFTPSSDDLGFVSEKVSANEYKVKVASYKEGGSVSIKVADKNSEISKEVVLDVKEAPVDAVAADRITLDSPKTLTEGEETWGTVTAQVQPENYDAANLLWEFEPSDAELGFEYEKVSDLQYKVRFGAYKEGGKVTVTVSDLVGGQYALREIAVEKRPLDGVVSLSVSPESISLFVGNEPTDLKVTTTPENYDRSLLAWSSSDEEVVTVDGGIITVVGEGEAVVKVKDTVSGKSAECNVTVKNPVTDIEVKSIVLDQKSLDMEVEGKDVQLIATCYDEAGNVVEDYAGLVWEASKDKDQNQLDIEIVKVSQQGVVTPVAEGMSIVTVSVSENRAVKAICEVRVAPKKIQVEEVILPPSIFIYVGGTFSLDASVLPEDAHDKTLTYTSSDESVATVDEEGVITAHAEGDVVITATAANGIKAECAVTVSKQYVDLGYTQLTLLVNDERTLVPILQPVGTENVQVTWESSDPEVVSVQNGTVKALKTGKAEITATTADGVTGVCNILVIDDFTITLKVKEEPAGGAPINLPQFETLKIEAEYSDGYKPEDVQWESSDQSLAVVAAEDGYGLVTAVYDEMMTEDEEQVVTITHRVGSKFSTKTIAITQALPKEIVVSNLPENNTIYLGDRLDLDVKVLPEQASQDITYWGDVEIYAVANGSHVAHDAGNFTLGIAASGSNVRVQFNITVLPKIVESGALTRTEVTLQRGKSAIVGVNFVPAGDETYDYNVLWTSADESVATVKDGRITAVGVGRTEISAKLSNGQVLKCVVTVVEASSNGINVGDYYYANGKTSSSPDVAGWGEVLGMVFSTLSPIDEGDDMLLADHPDCTHGLVVALEDADFGETKQSKWQNSDSYVNVSAWIIEEEGYRDLTDLDLLCGYSNTKMIRVFNESNQNSKVLVTENVPAVTLPQTTSGWYLPSYAEWQLLKSSLPQLKNKGLEIDDTWTYEWEADGYYWTSTENDRSQAYATHASSRSSGVLNKLKSKNYKVRYIFAF